ncbi:hypothetical protein Fot_03497 [Forsythia ovata]|uniref:Uncharacterized protein n=1 Tax=Forsythia ovata TaxID=205694 RepID=A0ABD1XCW9_9LAMI
MEVEFEKHDFNEQLPQTEFKQEHIREVRLPFQRRPIDKWWAEPLIIAATRIETMPASTYAATGVFISQQGTLYQHGFTKRLMNLVGILGGQVWVVIGPIGLW